MNKKSALIVLKKKKKKKETAYQLERKVASECYSKIRCIF